jgi:hypothetical protein
MRKDGPYHCVLECAGIYYETRDGRKSRVLSVKDEPYSDRARERGIRGVVCGDGSACVGTRSVLGRTPKPSSHAPCSSRPCYSGYW